MLERLRYLIPQRRGHGSPPPHLFFRTSSKLLVSILILLFVASGISSIRISHQTRKTVTIQLEQDYPAITALEKIRSSASRLTGAVIMQMTGREPESFSIFHQNAEIITENMNLIASLPTQPERERQIQKLREQVNILLSESERIISQSDSRSSAAVRYSQLLTPQVLEIAETTDRIAQLQRQNAQSRANEIVKNGREAAILWALATILGTGLLLFACDHLARHTFKPLQTIANAMKKIGDGDLDQTIRCENEEETGALCKAFNDMAAKLRITRQGTTEQMMRLHRTMETTLASFHNAFFVLGKDRNIELRNPAADKLAVKLFLEGQSKLPPVIYEHINKVLKTGQNYLPGNLRDALKFRIDNEEKFFLPRILRLLDEQDDIFGVAVILEDVTHQRLLDDVKTNLLSTVSHELKTPLTSVRMGLHLLLEEAVGPLNQQQFDLVGTAKEDSERLLRTLNNLLDLTRLEEDAPELEQTACSVTELVHSITKQQNSLRFILKIDEDLPPLFVDREKIGHVFSNFATNARKHSPPGTPVTIRAKRVLDDQVRISLIDQGPGIPKDQQERIFEKFYRVPGQASTGAGLGLSIAREIALLHRGNIGVISQPGSGSEFFIDLPIINPDET